ncbi:MAG: host attachment protein [Candidatus Thiodiazotropha sp.]
MKTWVVVASAARARIFDRSSTQGPLAEQADLLNPEDRLLQQEIVSDRPGSATNRQGGQRHGMEPRANPKEIQAGRFAAEVVDWLEAHHRSKDFDQLYLVAAPHFLGLLRNRMSQGLSDTVMAESDKDLTHERADHLAHHLQAIF